MAISHRHRRRERDINRLSVENKILHEHFESQEQTRAKWDKEGYEQTRWVVGLEKDEDSVEEEKDGEEQ